MHVRTLSQFTRWKYGSDMTTKALHGSHVIAKCNTYMVNDLTITIINSNKYCSISKLKCIISIILLCFLFSHPNNVDTIASTLFINSISACHRSQCNKSIPQHCNYLSLAIALNIDSNPWPSPMYLFEIKMHK